MLCFCEQYLEYNGEFPMVIKIQRFVILDCALYGCEDDGVGCHVLVVARVDLIENVKELEIVSAVHDDEGGKDFSGQQLAEVTLKIWLKSD